jgi:flagellar basal body L-ring protein FlgH
LARKLIVLTALALAASLISGCAAPPAPSTRPITTGQALAQSSCPHRIVEANAWVNHMPGPGRAARDLQVEVRFADASDQAMILKSAATKPGDTLVLEIRTVQQAQRQGRIDWREPVSDPPFKRISFFCRGAEIFALNEIQKVY